MTDLLLKDGADPNLQTKTGQLPLHIAIEKKRNKIVELLLDYSADPDKIATSTGKSSLHIAAQKNEFRVITLLVEHNVNTNIQDNQGNTPLHIATDLYSLQSLKILLSAGADSTIKNLNNKTPSQIAQQQGSIQILQEIVKFCPEIQNLETQRKSLSVPPPSFSTAYLTSSINKHPPITFTQYLKNKKRKNTADQNILRIENEEDEQQQGENKNNDLDQQISKQKKKLGSFLSVDNQFGMQPDDGAFKNQKGDMLSTIKLNGVNQSRITTPFSDQQNPNQEENSMMLMMIKSQQSLRSDKSKSPVIQSNITAATTAVNKDQDQPLDEIQNILKSSRNNFNSATATRVSSKEFTFKNMNYLRQSKIKSQMFARASQSRSSVDPQHPKANNIFNLSNQNRVSNIFAKPSFYQENSELRCSDMNILNDGDKENINFNQKSSALSNSQAPMIPPKSLCYRNDGEIKQSTELENSFLSKKCTEQSILSDPMMRVSFGLQKQQEIFSQINESIDQQREQQQIDEEMDADETPTMRNSQSNTFAQINQNDDPNMHVQNRKASLTQSYPALPQNTIPPKAPQSRQQSEKKQKLHPQTARHCKKSNRSFSLNPSQVAKLDLNTSIHEKYKQCEEFQQRVQDLMTENNRKVVDLLAGTTSSPLVSSTNLRSKTRGNFFIGNQFLSTKRSTEIPKQAKTSINQQNDLEFPGVRKLQTKRVNQSVRVGAISSRSNQDFLSQIEKGSLSVRSTVTSKPPLVSPTAQYTIFHNNLPSQVVTVKSQKTQKGSNNSFQKEKQVDQQHSQELLNSYISETDKMLSQSKGSLSSNAKQQAKHENLSSLQTKKSYSNSKILNFSMKNNRTKRQKACRANSQIDNGSSVKANLSSTRYASSFCEDQDEEEKQIQANHNNQESRMSQILKNVQISTHILQQIKQKEKEIQKSVEKTPRNILQQLSPLKNLVQKSTSKKNQKTNRCTIKSPLLSQMQHNSMMNSSRCSKMNYSCASEQVVQLFQFQQQKNLDLTSPIESQSMFNNSMCLGRDYLVQNYSFQESNFFESFIIAPHNLGPLKCKLSKTIGLMPSKSQQDISLRTIDKNMLKDQELMFLVGGEDDYQRKLGITQTDTMFSQQEGGIDQINENLFDANNILAVFKSRKNDIVRERNVAHKVQKKKMVTYNGSMMKNYLASKPIQKNTSRNTEEDLIKKSSFCSSNNSSMILQSCIRDGAVVPLESSRLTQQQLLLLNQQQSQQCQQQQKQQMPVKYRKPQNPNKFHAVKNIHKKHNHINNDQKKRIKTDKKFFTDQGQSDFFGRPSESDSSSSAFSQYYQHHPQLSKKIMLSNMQQQKPKYSHALATYRLKPPRPSTTQRERTQQSQILPSSQQSDNEQQEYSITQNEQNHLISSRMNQITTPTPDPLILLHDDHRASADISDDQPTQKQIQHQMDNLNYINSSLESEQQEQVDSSMGPAHVRRVTNSLNDTFMQKSKKKEQYFQEFNNNNSYEEINDDDDEEECIVNQDQFNQECINETMSYNISASRQQQLQQQPSNEFPDSSQFICEVMNQNDSLRTYQQVSTQQLSGTMEQHIHQGRMIYQEQNRIQSSIKSSNLSQFVDSSHKKEFNKYKRSVQEIKHQQIPTEEQFFTTEQLHQMTFQQDEDDNVVNYQPYARGQENITSSQNESMIPQQMYTNQCFRDSFIKQENSKKSDQDTQELKRVLDLSSNRREQTYQLDPKLASTRLLFSAQRQSGTSSLLELQEENYKFLEQWLDQELHLGHLAPLFAQSGLDDIDALVCQMSSNELKIDSQLLKKIGINKPGHRARILVKLQQEVKQIIKNKPANSIRSVSPYSRSASSMSRSNNNPVQISQSPLQVSRSKNKVFGGVKYANASAKGSFIGTRPASPFMFQPGTLEQKSDQEGQIQIGQKSSFFQCCTKANIVPASSFIAAPEPLPSDMIPTLKTWLSALRLGALHQMFIMSGYEDLLCLLKQMNSSMPINDQTLIRDIGINKIGYRTRILSKLVQDGKNYQNGICLDSYQEEDYSVRQQHSRRSSSSMLSSAHKNTLKNKSSSRRFDQHRASIIMKSINHNDSACNCTIF